MSLLTEISKRGSATMEYYEERILKHVPVCTDHEDRHHTPAPLPVPNRLKFINRKGWWVLGTNGAGSEQLLRDQH